MSFWKIPVFGEPLTTPPMSSEESGTRQYSDSEVDCLAKLDLLIEELTGAAEAAIEQAAAEGARAAALASLERESAAMREDINSRPLDEFLDDPGVRGAADNAAGEFRRKRDEAVRRIRGGLSGKARLAD
jgi:hypothetical protein